MRNPCKCLPGKGAAWHVTQSSERPCLTRGTGHTYSKYTCSLPKMIPPPQVSSGVWLPDHFPPRPSGPGSLSSLHPSLRPAPDTSPHHAPQPCPHSRDQGFCSGWTLALVRPQSRLSPAWSRPCRAARTPTGTLATAGVQRAIRPSCLCLQTSGSTRSQLKSLQFLTVKLDGSQQRGLRISVKVQTDLRPGLKLPTSPHRWGTVCTSSCAPPGVLGEAPTPPGEEGPESGHWPPNTARNGPNVPAEVGFPFSSVT